MGPCASEIFLVAVRLTNKALIGNLEMLLTATSQILQFFWNEETIIFLIPLIPHNKNRPSRLIVWNNKTYLTFY